MHPRSVLIVKPDTYGDLVLISALVGRLAEAWPGCKIHILVRKGYEDVAEILPARVSWLTTSIDPYIESPSGANKSVACLLRDLKSIEPEVVIAGSISMTWLEVVVAANFSCARTIAFEKLDIAKGMESDLKKAYGLDPHTVFGERITFDAEIEDWRNWLVMADRLLEVESEFTRPRLSIPEALQSKADRWLAEKSLLVGKWMACCPAGTANVPLKAWPGQAFVETLGRLYRERGLSSLLLGHTDEDSTLSRIAHGLSEQEVPVCVWMGDGGDIGVLAALIRRARLYFGNDTGAMHLAAALDVPVAAVFGGGTWPRFRPAGRRTAVIFQPLDCFGCSWECPFGTAPCLGLIPQNIAYQALEWILEDIGVESHTELRYNGEIDRFGSFKNFSKHHSGLLVESWREKEAVIQEQLKRIAALERELEEE